MTDARSKSDASVRAHVGANASGVRCEIDGVPAVVELSDLSAVGLFVQTQKPLALDAEVRVKVRFGSEVFEANGHVVQSVTKERAQAEGRKPGYALLFTHFDEAERMLLRKRVDAAIARRTASLRPMANPPQRPVTEPNLEEQALLVSLRRERQALAGKTPWQVLCISQGSDASAAKEAFFAASKRYHPHLFARFESAEIKQLVTELFITHKRAYTTMQRTSGAQSLVSEPSEAPRASPPPVEAQRPASRPQSPSQPAERPTPEPTARAVMPLRTHTPARGIAIAPARPTPAHGISAGSLRPQQDKKVRVAQSFGIDADSYMGEAIKQLSQNRYDEAEAELRKALSIDAQSPKARVWLLLTQARRCKAQNELDEAQARYLEILTLDPKHHEALSETKRHSKDSRDKAPGLLGRLFGSGGGDK